MCDVVSDGRATQTLNQFLTSCNLSHLEDVLLANGFDELDFMVGTVQYSAFQLCLRHSGIYTRAVPAMKPEATARRSARWPLENDLII